MAEPIFGIPVATGSNNLNSQGGALPSARNRTSTFIQNVVPANSVLPVPCAGNTFYVVAASSDISIRPSGGSFNRYQEGTGLALDLVNAFQLLEIKNDNAFAVAFQVFVGFDGLIDNRIFLNENAQPSVVYPTNPTAAATTSIAITDRTGQLFADINGNEWFALYRVAIIVCNIDSGVTLLLQRSGATTSSGPAIAAIYPLTSLNLPVAGNYSISVGGGPVNCIVSEIYKAIPRFA